MATCAALLRGVPATDRGDSFQLLCIVKFVPFFIFAIVELVPIFPIAAALRIVRCGQVVVVIVGIRACRAALS